MRGTPRSQARPQTVGELEAELRELEGEYSQEALGVSELPEVGGG